MMNFNKKVLDLVKQVPRGSVTTYKIIAEKLNTKSYQAVGQALKNNPDAPTIPCHRVISSNFTIGGFKGDTSGQRIREKIALLKNEGVEVKKGKIDRNYLFRF